MRDVICIHLYFLIGIGGWPCNIILTVSVDILEGLLVPYIGIYRYGVWLIKENCVEVSLTSVMIFFPPFILCDEWVIVFCLFQYLFMGFLVIRNEDFFVASIRVKKWISTLNRKTRTWLSVYLLVSSLVEFRTSFNKVFVTQF